MLGLGEAECVMAGGTIVLVVMCIQQNVLHTYTYGSKLLVQLPKYADYFFAQIFQFEFF